MARNPWEKPDKDNSSWATPTSKHQSPAVKKDHRFDSKDDPKRAFTKDQSAKDAIAKRLFGGK
jgi:hypothetical protein